MEFVIDIQGRLERMVADDAEAAARKAVSRCSVGQLAAGCEIITYTLQEQERWRFQYEYRDGSITEGRWHGEAVGIQVSKAR